MEPAKIPAIKVGQSEHIVDKVCTAAWNKDIESLKLLTRKSNVNLGGPVKRNRDYPNLMESLCHMGHLEIDPPVIRLAANQPFAAPIHYAAAHGDIPTIELLLTIGADKYLVWQYEVHHSLLRLPPEEAQRYPLRKVYDYLFPYEIAEENGHFEAARLLDVGCNLIFCRCRPRPHFIDDDA